MPVLTCNGGGGGGDLIIYCGSVYASRWWARWRRRRRPRLGHRPVGRTRTPATVHDERASRHTRRRSRTCSPRVTAAKHAYTTTMLSVDAPFVVLCSLLAVAAAGTPRLRNYQPVIFEGSTAGNEEPRFLNTDAKQKDSGGGRSCCGAYPSTSSSSTATATTDAAVVDDFKDVDDRTPKEVNANIGVYFHTPSGSTIALLLL